MRASGAIGRIGPIRRIRLIGPIGAVPMPKPIGPHHARQAQRGTRDHDA